MIKIRKVSKWLLCTSVLTAAFTFSTMPVFAEEEDVIIDSKEGNTEAAPEKTKDELLWESKLVKIDGVSLNIGYTIKNGKTKINITKLSSKWKVVSSKFTNLPPSGKWDDGIIPNVSLHLSPKDYEYMEINTSGQISVTGGTVKSSRWECGNLFLSIDLEPVSETLYNPRNIKWVNGTTASWEETEKADNYEIKLFKNNTEIKRVTLLGSYTDFSESMREGGTYYFQIRSMLSDELGDILSSKEMIVDGEGRPKFENQSYWMKDDINYWYHNADGTYPKNTWQLIDTSWYYFDHNGYVKTGWFEYKDKWYYLSDSGVMLFNTTTPDGYEVDENGTFIK